MPPSVDAIPKKATGSSVLKYRACHQEHFAHVARFSGGRSSAMMTLILAEAGLLQAERGDVVLFANTTAEHPDTYEFAKQVCDEVENRFGVPCFWYEGCTVEVATRVCYTRTRTYRLVKRQPAESGEDPARPGYRFSGEAFEEMVSWARLPSRWRRLCTSELKVQPGNELVSEWLAGGVGPSRRGHHRDQTLAPAEAVAARYQGSLSREDRQGRLEAVCRQPWFRPAQDWQDFTSVRLGRPIAGPRASADIWGRYGPPQGFVSMLGLRADEPERVMTAMWRSLMAEGASGAGCRDRSQPAGEFLYCPLSDSGIDGHGVRDFWSRRSYDLRVPDGAGNCVYCFLKGPAALARLAAGMPTDDREIAAGTPVDIRWWSRLETEYGRPSTHHDGLVGMFHDTDYDRIMQRASEESNGQSEKAVPSAIPCACTD